MKATVYSRFATLILALKRQGKFFYPFVVTWLVPIPGSASVPTVAFRLLAVLAFVAGVYALGEKHSHWFTALGLALPAIVPFIILTVRPSARLMGPTLLCTLIFLEFSLVSFLRAVLCTTKVAHDTVYGSMRGGICLWPLHRAVPISCL